MTRRMVTLFVILMVALLFGTLLGTGNAQEFGSNWTATYYNTTDLSGSVVATEVGLPGINFNWGTSSPRPGVVNVDNFSIRYSSTQNFQAGTYRFIVTSDDGVRVHES